MYTHNITAIHASKSHIHLHIRSPRVSGEDVKNTHTKRKKDMQKLATRCGPPSRLREEDLKH